MTTDNSRSVIGLAADMFVGWSRTWNVRGRGKTVEYLWMIHRMLPGHHAGCFVDANLSAS
jgi:hypothetical protein